MGVEERAKAYGNLFSLRIRMVASSPFFLGTLDVA